MHGVKLKSLASLTDSDEDHPPVMYSNNVKPIDQTSCLTPTKVIGHDLFEGSLSYGLDTVNMEMFGDIGGGLNFPDSLGNASMDSFTDLNAYFSQNTGPDQREEGYGAQKTSDFLDLDADMKSNRHSWKCSFEEVEDNSSDLGRLSVNVGLKRSRMSSFDHDYVVKRPRLLLDSAEISAEESTSGTGSYVDPGLSPFLSTECGNTLLVPSASLSPSPSSAPAPGVSPVPSLSPEPSTSPSPNPSTSDSPADLTRHDKHRMRREKNNQASKRSREIRKQKFSNMEVEVDRLTIENVLLEKRVDEMEKMAKRMKDILLQKLKLP